MFLIKWIIVNKEKLKNYINKQLIMNRIQFEKTRFIKQLELDIDDLICKFESIKFYQLKIKIKKINYSLRN